MVNFIGAAATGGDHGPRRDRARVAHVAGEPGVPAGVRHSRSRDDAFAEQVLRQRAQGADAGAHAVRLGAEVLRTSTAGVVAVAAVLARTSRWA